MKCKIFIIVMFFATLLFSVEKQDVDKEKDAIKKVVVSAYQEGISNVGDEESIRKWFNPGFNLMGIGSKGDLWKLPIYNWIHNVKLKKQAGKYPPKEKVTFKFLFIDIEGTAAVAKLDYYRGKNRVYTDYLSLYKFKDGWKIVNKIYYQHKNPEKK